MLFDIPMNCICSVDKQSKGDFDFDSQPFVDAFNYLSKDTKEERGGFIVKGVFHPVKNVSLDPENCYEADTIKCFSLVGDGVDAMVHSHPNGAPLSDSDIFMRNYTPLFVCRKKSKDMWEWL